MPLTTVNVAVAEALDTMGAALEKRLAAHEDRTQAMLAVIREVYGATKAIVFNGNNYEQAWAEEAARRGLANDRDTPAALRVLDDPDTLAFFEQYGIFRPHEVKARYTILLEQYVRTLDIEAVQMMRMAKQGVLPAAFRQQKELADGIAAASAQGVDVSAQKQHLGLYAEALNAAVKAVDVLRKPPPRAPYFWQPWRPGRPRAVHGRPLRPGHEVAPRSLRHPRAPHRRGLLAFPHVPPVVVPVAAVIPPVGLRIQTKRATVGGRPIARACRAG